MGYWVNKREQFWLCSNKIMNYECSYKTNYTGYILLYHEYMCAGRREIESTRSENKADDYVERYDNQNESPFKQKTTVVDRGIEKSYDEKYKFFL